MEHVGIDLAKNQSHVCVRTEEGKYLHFRVRTSREDFARVLSTRKECRILLEASTESEWVARWMEELGHEVVVADPNYAPMYAHRTRRIKTDRRDAHALATANYLEAYRASYRIGDEPRHVRGLLASRDALVRTRSKFLFLMGALLRRDGHRVRGGSAETFASRVSELELSESLEEETRPLLALLPGINEQIARIEESIEKLMETNRRVQLLKTVFGVGPLTASAFVSVIGNPHRFKNAHQVESYLGLVPSEYSSGETQRRGHITKQGNTRLRTLLIQAAWVIVRGSNEETAALRVEDCDGRHRTSFSRHSLGDAARRQTFRPSVSPQCCVATEGRKSFSSVDQSSTSRFG